MPSQDLKMSELPKMRDVKVVGDHRLAVTFNDGASGELTLDWLFTRIGPMNEPLVDPAYFARVFLDRGALTWPNGFDLSPWNIRERLEAAGALKLPATAAK